MALKAALDGGARYIGFIASTRKAASVKAALAADGHDDARLAAIRPPAGLDIGARGPEEVALAILAEIVELRRGGPRQG